jgi:hypothetical protein
MRVDLRGSDRSIQLCTIHVDPLAVGLQDYIKPPCCYRGKPFINLNATRAPE